MSQELRTHYVMFPLRPGLVIELGLPVEITEADADRLNGIIASLAFPDEGATP